MSMTPAGASAALVEESSVSSTIAGTYDSRTSLAPVQDQFRADAAFTDAASTRRRTPRRSLIVVLPENHSVPADVVSDHLAASADSEEVAVILACAGQPNGISALQRKIRDLQVLLAPPGTSGEDLREMAMTRAPGDIVTLLNGTLLGG
jgi:hypothetical protein